uniref:Metalloendopeptidase n=1 Tax=Romanomermis culicivorax TaxID=13658 RepID=A0A915K8R5_ROMCU
MNICKTSQSFGLYGYPSNLVVMFLILFLFGFLNLFDKSLSGFISLAAYSRYVHIGSHLLYVIDEKLEHKLGFLLTDHSCKEAIHESLQYLTDVSCLTFDEAENVTQNATGFFFKSSNDVNDCFSEENGLAEGKFSPITVGYACGAKIEVKPSVDMDPGYNFEKVQRGVNRPEASRVLNFLRVILYVLGFQFEHNAGLAVVKLDFNLTNVDPKFYRLFFNNYNLQLPTDEYKNITPYDISSIMHFGAQEHCTYYDKPVFKAKNPLMQWSLGHNLKMQSDWLSFRDKLTLNYLMHCN